MLEVSINGEPLLGDKTIVNFRILTSKVKIIDEMARRQRLSRSQIINLCIDNALANSDFVEQFDYQFGKNSFDE